jgi:hypothetical protein
LFSAVCGWWGLPWGLILTPIQIGRNVFGLFTKPNPAQPSAQLEALLRNELAEKVIAERKKRKTVSA